MRGSSSCSINSERVLSGPSVFLSGGELIEFYERGNWVVFGNTIEQNMVRAEVHVSSCIWSLRAYLGARDGHKPAWFLSNWSRQEDVFLFKNRK